MRQHTPADRPKAAAAAFIIRQATRNDIEWIARLEYDIYSPQNAVARHSLEEWYGANPTGFYVITLAGGGLIGHLSVLPLRPQTLRLLIEGALAERDIKGDSIIPPGERGQIRTLYVESVIVSPPEGCSKGPAVLALLCNLKSVGESMCELSNLESVYATAASDFGARLMGHLGFSKVTSGEHRKDGRDFYAASVADLKGKVEKLCKFRLG